MQHVRPAAPVAPWLGGKKRLYPLIIDKIEAIPHQSYVEPFVGMGGVFLRRRFRPPCEVVNDRNGEIVNLFTVVQRRLPELLEAMRFTITSRYEYERLRKIDPTGLSDIDRAARFLYLQRLAFGGRIGHVLACRQDLPRASAWQSCGRSSRRPMIASTASYSSAWTGLT